jgi:hypothetical protein
MLLLSMIAQDLTKAQLTRLIDFLAEARRLIAR